jgi:hypothetical protein
MKKGIIVAAAMMVTVSTQAQTKRTDDFHAKYQLKEVVVMSRHNIRSPLTSGGAAYMRVTPHEWFKWSSPSSQLSLRGGVLETEMGQFFRKWVVSEGLLPDNYRPERLRVGDDTSGMSYSYLTFKTTDGAKVSVSTTGLSLSISGTMLTAGSQTFTLSNLNRMYFSTTDESTTTGIKTIDSSQLSMDESVDVYDLQGDKVEKSQMRNGTYIVKTKNGTFKIAVK